MLISWIERTFPSITCLLRPNQIAQAVIRIDLQIHNPSLHLH
ncbi:hypothetical protein V6Z11_D11G232500 [Gossypium hirsutum]